jgi:hypothetical protein
MVSSQLVKIDVPECAACRVLMTLQDVRHNEPEGGVDALLYECEVCRHVIPV